MPAIRLKIAVASDFAPDDERATEISITPMTAKAIANSAIGPGRSPTSIAAKIAACAGSVRE